MYQTTEHPPTTKPKTERIREALEENPFSIIRELNNRSLFHFIEFFWDEVSGDAFVPNWHIEYLCKELEKIGNRVGTKKRKQYDLIINIPPGTTKTITVSIMFPVWCWTKWPWMRFIAGSYSGALSLESAEYSRDLVRSEKFKIVYPELEIKDDKDTKSNFKLIKKTWINTARMPQIEQGGNRYSTSVGGTLTGFHGHILIVDDPLNPHQAMSEKEISTANRWCDQTLSTRKADKLVTTQITVMQRVHQNDPSGHMLAKKKKNTRLICLPGQIRNYYDQLEPKKLASFYRDGLLDPVRMPWTVLEEMEADLGQYGFSGQVGQKPTPPGGGMFKVDNFTVIDTLPSLTNVKEVVRYWDKAGTADGGAYTVGVKMMKYGNKFIITDVKRGQWAAETRESKIKNAAESDGTSTKIFVEQEPGSGGKESAESTIRNLVGFSCYADKPTGDKIYRADPYSVQVNNGAVLLLRGDWNYEFIHEHENFPFSTYKDQVDAASGAFSQLTTRKSVKVL